MCATLLLIAAMPLMPGASSQQIPYQNGHQAGRPRQVSNLCPQLSIQQRTRPCPLCCEIRPRGGAYRYERISPASPAHSSLAASFHPVARRCSHDRHSSLYPPCPLAIPLSRAAPHSQVPRQLEGITRQQYAQSLSSTILGLAELEDW